MDSGHQAYRARPQDIKIPAVPRAEILAASFSLAAIMTSAPAPDLGSFYRVLGKGPLDPGDPEYVPFVEESVSGDPVAEIATRIDFSEAASVSLLTGMRGNGKSTALRRLQHSLESQGIVTFRADMLDYVNRTEPVAIVDFLVSAMIALAEGFAQRYDDHPAKVTLWDEVKSVLSQRVKVDELGLETGVDGFKASLKASLVADPTFKQRMQRALEGHVALLIKEAHAFSDRIVSLVQEREGRPDAKVVMLFDSLEQIRGANAESAIRVQESVRRLFGDYMDALTLPRMHALYTVPPYLPALLPNLGGSAGCMVSSLPSVHVRMSDGSPDPAGLATMRLVVARRCADWNLVFTPEQVDRMALATGGDLRDFFLLMRTSIVKARSTGVLLPVPDDVIDRAEADMRRSMATMIAENDRAWLRAIALTKSTRLDSIERLPHLARFFDAHLVLNYRNGDDWYDVHPLLAPALEAS